MNIIQQFIKSLYSPETIAKFRFQKIGKAILYVFFLMLITSIPAGIMLGSGFNSLYNQVDTHLNDSVPDFTIQNGVLDADVEEPVVIDEEDGVIIFDPTGEYSLTDVSTYGDGFAMLEREAVFITGGITESFNYQQLGLNVSRDQVLEFSENVGGLLPLIIGLILVFMYIFTTGLKFIGIFTLSLITLFMKRNTASQLRYRHCWVLSVYAVTLPTTLFAVIEALGIFIPFSFTIYWVIAIIMMYFVLREVPQPKQPDAPVPPTNE
ncbi:DUF1189 domain-containing protein [Bacillus shivajii]|uniref:DUF1189 domain-containing protein n=1 Tax=Bacillus shivajii TaxID=1983719 RepID=UPI001CF951B5|nr:DUF1189 domain-containing protein [Bacillus shivajii]UCZ54539.1 DUF1189 domain-containing protein [Bacillus shivajii]